MEKKRGIPGSTVKIIAVAAMLIDHVAAAILTRMVLREPLRYFMGGAEEQLYYIVIAMRAVGRLGFPIFCFLLVEGFQKTRNVKKYVFRLGLFALISEIPFNLAFTGEFMEFGYQNVYFTLLFGILALWGFDTVAKHCGSRALILCGDTAVLAAAMAAAHWLKTDYSAMGVLTIAVMYALRKNRVLSMAGGCAILVIMSVSEIPAFLTLIPVALYNGERGLKMKYFFYIFYPAHLLIIWLICWAMGMGWMSAI